MPNSTMPARIPAATAEAPDPIFAAIEEQRRLEDEFTETARREKDDSDITAAAMDRANDAFAALVETVPQSKEGVVALANYFVAFHARDLGVDEEEVFACLRSIAASPALTGGFNANGS